MKIRHPLFIKAAGFAGAWLLRGWLRTLRYQYCPLGPDLDPRLPHLRHCIYAFWHENLLLPALRFSGVNAHVLISQHADGQLIANIIQRLGFKTIRGSTTRGGVQALLRLLTLNGSSHLGITPDGPRGPRRRVQLGVIALSSYLHMPIVPAGFAYDRPWRMKSWDRFAVPRLRSRAACVTDHPVLVPPHAARGLLEEYRQCLEERLAAATAAAENWILTGQAPRPIAHVPLAA